MLVVQNGEVAKGGKKVTFAAQAVTTEANLQALSSTLKRIIGQK